MSWAEFSNLLAGIMPKTPLGQIVSIRSEDDADMLKNFTPEQHRIRNEWRNRQTIKQFEDMTEEEKEMQIKDIQEIFAKTFS